MIRTIPAPVPSGTGRAIMLAAVIAAALLAGLLLPVKQFLMDFVAWIDGLGAIGYAAIIAAYVVACVLFLPGAILTIASGALFGLVAGTIVVSVGSTIGAGAAFLVGRHLARGMIEGKISANPKFGAIDRAVGEQGFKIVLLTRLSPVFPFNVLNYAFGLTRVSFRSYLLASWIGMFPGSMMYVYLGSTAKDLAQVFAGGADGGTAQTLLRLAGLLATIAVTVLITRTARGALSGAIGAD